MNNELPLHRAPPRASRGRASLFGLSLAAALLPSIAGALECNGFDGTKCRNSTPVQYAGGFNPSTGHGGFGGGSCTATRTPVVFVHDNGDNAIGWAAPPASVAGYPTAPRSIYAELKARGYNDCELFGVTYLSPAEQAAPALNFSQQAKLDVVRNFINAVKTYTGKSQVDIVVHGMGAPITLAALKQHNLWGSVRKFVNIAGGLRGLNSCYYTGYSNAGAPVCGSQNAQNAYIFGAFPEGWYYGTWVTNNWTGSGSPNAMRDAPKYRPNVLFYTVHAGSKDQIACTTGSFRGGCDLSSLFSGNANVRAQINIGAGIDAAQINWNWKEGAPYGPAGGDATNGVGHLKARSNSGTIVQRILLTDCFGMDCAADYTFGPKTTH